MRWITVGGPEPPAPGWYPTISRWVSEGTLVTGAHRWLGSEWVKFAAECIDCYYAEAFDSAETAIQRAHVLNPELDVASPCLPPRARLAS